MAREFAKTFYHSQAWKHTQAAYTKQAGRLCERCLARGIVTPGVIVHHIQPLTPENIGDPAITLSPDNLQLVCRDCHAEIHKEKPARYRIDELGRVIPQPV